MFQTKPHKCLIYMHVKSPIFGSYFNIFLLLNEIKYKKIIDRYKEE